MTQTAVPNTTKTTEQTTQKKGVVSVFQTKWINKNLYFFIYLALLTIGYIAYGHWTDKTLRKISDTKKEIEVLEYKYRSAVIEASKVNQQSAILKNVNSKGLGPGEASPIVIKK